MNFQIVCFLNVFIRHKLIQVFPVIQSIWSGTQILSKSMFMNIFLIMSLFIVVLFKGNILRYANSLKWNESPMGHIFSVTITGRTKGTPYHLFESLEFLWRCMQCTGTLSPNESQWLDYHRSGYTMIETPAMATHWTSTLTGIFQENYVNTMADEWWFPGS